MEPQPDAPTPRDTTIAIPGFEIGARIWGPDDGRPVLATHGWLDNAASFDRLAPLLVDQPDATPLRIVAIDFPGHGRSTHRPAGASYHFIDLVPTTFDIADALGWQTFAILGHSMGAGAASLVAGTLPERVERMALIDGLNPWTNPADKAAEQLAKALGERKALQSKTNRVFVSRQAAVETIARLYDLTPDQARPLLDRGLRQTDAGFEMTYDLQLRAASMMRLTDDQVRAFNRRIRCPVLVVRPESGWPISAGYFEERLGTITDAQLLKIPGGHHVHLQTPEAIAGPIRRFLSGQTV